ncbi:MAG: putative quercetin 2,3-dioxygenase [Paracidovorax wautersii]|uniref:Putative quercetin 2,3-dioxygenase n=1 Tax=Paracidovorax wautersii TaxID=1177982 RepID=A0A7V8FSA9_9BURK|nr:MAG: putative quercetin 2,3-dioxygenase [Paracidovorax wautersii]
MKKLVSVHGRTPQHWVGDGFPVRTLFGYNDLGQIANPFLMLDYVSPTAFEPAVQPRGVGQHPHRGFETVTIVYQGELAHRDSTGQGGVIGPGDVQWMTAAGGILHEEFHSPAFTREGGVLQNVQLWVNLPARDKSAAPGYQSITAADIPAVELPDGAGRLRVIAGDFDGTRGPARTFTPINVWDVALADQASVSLPVPEGHVAMVAVLHGRVRVNGPHDLRDAQVALLSREGASLELTALSGGTPEDGGQPDQARLLVLSAEPIDEPVFGYGPFVMNSREEIVQAVQDFNAGRFGRMAQSS